MKKLFLILTFSSAIAITAQAQTDFQTKAVFGLKAGANLSNVYDDTNEQFVSDPKLGFVAGGFLTLPIGKFFAIQPEILFAQRGFHSTNSTLGINYENTRTTEYIDIPVLISIRPSKYVSILFGPQLSYLLKQTDKVTSNLGNAGSEEVFKNNNVRKNTVCFTGGVEVPLEHLVISARAGWDIKDNNGDGTTSSIRYKDMWYQATLGYRF
jgi:hypothetical protein